MMLWFLGLSAVLCVRYAHSAELEFTTKKMAFHYCELGTDHEGETALFRPGNSPKSEFRAFWPDEPSDVVVNAIRDDDGRKIDETLTIHFVDSNGQIQPEGYTYKKTGPFGKDLILTCKGLKAARA